MNANDSKQIMSLWLLVHWFWSSYNEFLAVSSLNFQKSNNPQFKTSFKSVEKFHESKSALPIPALEPIIGFTNQTSYILQALV